MSPKQMSAKGDDKSVNTRLGAWFALSIGIGVAFGLIIDKLAVGIAFGVAIGIAIETARAKKARRGSANPIADESQEPKP